MVASRILPIFFVLTSFSCQAQFEYGIRGGAQGITISGSREDREWKLSYHVGVFGQYSFHRKFSVVADVLYSKKGYKDPYSDYYYADYRFHYLTLPLMARYNLSRKLSVLAGGEMGILLSSQATAHQLGHSKQLSVRYELGNPIDFGVGGAVAWQAHPRINLMLRYIHGLSNVVSKGVINPPPPLPATYSYNLRDMGVKVHNETVQLSVGFFISEVVSN